MIMKIYIWSTMLKTKSNTQFQIYVTMASHVIRSVIIYVKLFDAQRSKRALNGKFSEFYI